jgi:membrane protein
MTLKKTWPILKGTFSDFGEDKVLRLSAALAYYAMFSIGPLLVIAVGLAGLAFGHDSVRRQIEQQLQSMLGESSAKMVDSMMSTQKHSTSVISTIVGLVALLFGAAGVFGQLQDSLNTIWGVKAKPGAGIWGLIRARLLSFSMVLGIGFLLLISMALTTFLTAVSGSIGGMLGVSEALAQILNFVVSFAVISLLFAMIFKLLPDIKVPFRKVWVGAIGTALLFTIGKYLLALYLGRESTTSSYGAAGSVIVVLMWIYYASVILLFGAEFSQVHARQTGTRIVPTKYAVAVTQDERAEQGMSDGKESGKAGAAPARQPAGGAAERHPRPAFAISKSLAEGPGRVPKRTQQFVTPGRIVRREPWPFLGLMVAAGFAGGILLRSKLLRKGLQRYLVLRKS